MSIEIVIYVLSVVVAFAVGYLLRQREINALTALLRGKETAYSELVELFMYKNNLPNRISEAKREERQQKREGELPPPRYEDGPPDLFRSRSEWRPEV